MSLFSFMQRCNLQSSRQFSTKKSTLLVALGFSETLKSIKDLAKNLIRRDVPKPLGRWNLEECNKKTNFKIDLSNEDHCGPCGQYALNKIESNNTINTGKK